MVKQCSIEETNLFFLHLEFVCALPRPSQIAYQFRADLRMVLEKLAWAEWRVDLLTGETALMAMVTITRANLQALHNGFHANSEGNTMITEAKEFGNKVLKGMATSLFASSEAAAEVFGCSNAKPVGDICEAFFYFGLIDAVTM